jgi:hypothetical protein
MPPGTKSPPTSAMIRPIETALANAVLSIASDDSRDVDVLKNAALQRMALDYRDGTPTYQEHKRRATSRDKADN